jgi:transposase
VRSYREKGTGKTKSAIIKSIGYLDELSKEYEDPITHFRELAKKMTEEEKTTKRLSLAINMNEELSENGEGRKNFGYAAIVKIYHELGLHDFLNYKSKYKAFEYNTNSIMLLLVISRLLSPGSKKRAFEEKSRYFERFDFELEDIYRSLPYFDKLSNELQRYMNEKIIEKYGRNTQTIYYDVTNFYFEIDQADELRKFGVSKENRRDPLVQLGLAMDADGLPLHHQLFEGNKLDKETFRSVIGEIKRNYGTGRIIVVADMGIITGDNINYLIGNKPDKPLNGYVFSFSVRGGTKEFKDYVLENEGYVDEKGNPADKDVPFKIKSRIIAREINITLTNGKTQKKSVYEKQVVFYGKKYADKARTDRAELVKKAADYVSNPGKYNKSTSYGAAKYVKNIECDKETGEIIDYKKIPVLDYDRLSEEEKFDGYYAIVTSELHMHDNEIIETYRGLWEIEETFKITKCTLESRPVYVSKAEHIRAHFLSCFIALVIIRLIRKKINKVYSTEKILDCLRQISCSNEKENIYLFDYRSEISNAIGDVLGIDFSKKRLYLSEIKNVLADAKK